MNASTTLNMSIHQGWHAGQHARRKPHCFGLALRALEFSKFENRRQWLAVKLSVKAFWACCLLRACRSAVFLVQNLPNRNGMLRHYVQVVDNFRGNLLDFPLNGL